jgi:hypothetical protein
MDAAEAPPIVQESPFTEENREERPVLELGAGGFLLAGGPTGGYAGFSPFVVGELRGGVILRPSLAFGESVDRSVRGTIAIARMDTCGRMKGLYARGSGIQLDVCGGLDAGFSRVTAGAFAGAPTEGLTLPYIALGPSIDLRAEVGRFAVTLRVGAGFNIARESFVDSTGTTVEAPLVPLRFDLGFSWDLHGG